MAPLTIPARPGGVSSSGRERFGELQVRDLSTAQAPTVR